MTKTFSVKLRNSGVDTFELTIPKSIVQYEGMQAGDEIELAIISIKKKEGDSDVPK